MWCGNGAAAALVCAGTGMRGLVRWRSWRGRDIVAFFVPGWKAFTLLLISCSSILQLQLQYIVTVPSKVAFCGLDHNMLICASVQPLLRWAARPANCIRVLCRGPG